MRRSVAHVMLAVLAVAAACGGRTGVAGDRDVVLATTTSLTDTGLLDSLRADFEVSSGRRLKIVSVGSGAALALGRRGEADVLLAHSPAAEEEFVRGGYALLRHTVMHNDFVIVGPADDPAGAAAAADAIAALRLVAQRGTPWVSRDDGSGTDGLDRALWREAGATPQSQLHIRSGLGMGATLRVADERRAYTLADRATFEAFSARLQSRIVFAGDPRLLNLYSIIVVEPARFPEGQVNAAGAREFAEWLLRPDVQRRIGEFSRGAGGQPLFTPGAPTDPAVRDSSWT